LSSSINSSSSNAFSLHLQHHQATAAEAKEEAHLASLLTGLRVQAAHRSALDADAWSVLEHSAGMLKADEKNPPSSTADYK
jgi:hypothetical protein